MGFQSIFLIACAAFTICYATSEELVPVYMWETSRTSEIVPALGHINAATFKEILLQKTSKDPFVVVFAEQTLSPEDFIEREGVKPFQHLAKLNEKVSYLPMVEHPISIVKEIPYRDVAQVSIQSILDGHVPAQRTLIVNLNDAREDEDRIDMLKRHDESIVAVYKKIIESHENVLAMYTGLHSSWVVPELPISRQSRSLLANDEKQAGTKEGEATPAYYQSQELMFYVSDKPTFQPTTGDAIILEIENMTFADNVATFKTASGDSIMITFAAGGGYWWVAEVNVTIGGNEYKLQGLRSYLPRTFSYHCSDLRITNLPDKGQPAEVLTLPGLQMQYFETTMIHQDTFGDSYDCVGFTTTPIWSGLFVTLIMVLILTAGLIAMMDIKTMDRFDDPKGKTIIINASE